MGDEESNPYVLLVRKGVLIFLYRMKALALVKLVKRPLLIFIVKYKRALTRLMTMLYSETSE